MQGGEGGQWHELSKSSPQSCVHSTTNGFGRGGDQKGELELLVGTSLNTLGCVVLRRIPRRQKGVFIMRQTTSSVVVNCP